MQRKSRCPRGHLLLQRGVNVRKLLDCADLGIDLLQGIASEQVAAHTVFILDQRQRPVQDRINQILRDDHNAVDITEDIIAGGIDLQHGIAVAAVFLPFGGIPLLPDLVFSSCREPGRGPFAENIAHSLSEKV